MAIIGSWVSARIEKGVITNMAAATALFLDNFVEPHVRDLAFGGLTAEHRAALAELMRPSSLGNRLVSFNVRDINGRVVFSSRGEVTAEGDALNAHFKSAASGEVAGKFWEAGYADGGPANSPPRPLLEIYAPVRLGKSGKVIAVAEFFEDGEPLRRQLQQAKRQSWFVVMGATLAALALQFSIVWGGSRTIKTQKEALKDQVRELSMLLEQNVALRQRVDQARYDSQDLSERFMRRLGADLHDGPAQLIAISILMLEPCSPDAGNESKNGQRDITTDEIALARTTLVDALDEIRLISAGLILPRLEGLTLKQVLGIAASAHAKRTGTAVATEFHELPEHVNTLQQATLYRVAQEGLNNAYFHAAGKNQILRARGLGAEVEIEVLDSGPGVKAGPPGPPTGRLGLIGLKDRVESLRGQLVLENRAEGGSRLHARLPIVNEEQQT
jgi:signal transduction histidine kinase